MNIVHRTTRGSDYVNVLDYYVCIPVQPRDLIMFMYLYNQGILLCFCTYTTRESDYVYVPVQPTRGSDYVYVHCTNRGSDYVYVLVQPGDLIMFMYLYNQGI